MATPTVFISYSHKDEDWKDRLVTQLGVLKHEGIIDLWDDRRIGGGDDWFPEIEKAINAASVAILMISANFLTSNFILKEEVPRLLQRREKEGLRVFPVIVKPCAWDQVKWLNPIQARPKDGRPLSGGTEHQIDTDLAAIAKEIARIVRSAGSAASPSGTPPGPDKISLAKLPSTSPDLFGREKELKALDDAWSNPKINVVSLVAWGGVGKTALVNKWLSQMGEANYRGAERVFGWSFYSQGAAEGKQNSADLFIATALKWFGDPDPKQGSPWDKGARLAELVKHQRALLILDGLEPLQNPPPIETGRIKDPGLCCLLRELARQNQGLAILTTRLPVDDLKDFIGTSVQEIELDHLSLEAGAQYLQSLGVAGTHTEREQAARDYKGHALALTLLGRYLVDVYQGDIRKRDLIPKLIDEEEKGGHARKMMAAYEKWFEGKPEQNILYMLGLFDRPAEKRAIQALLAAPRIAGLTDRVQGIAGSKWALALKHLRSARLLAERDPRDTDTIDSHPLIREHFGEELKASNRDAWREAHSRLYEYYKSVPKKESPDTIEEMAPLLAAVAHGCQAGRQQEALLDVFSRRVDGGQAFLVNKLGATGAALASLSGFFASPWQEPSGGLDEESVVYVLNNAGLCLRALGRLAEAARPVELALDAAIAAMEWRSAAVAAGNLKHLYLILGDLKQAIDHARRSVDFADRSGDAFQRLSKRAILANAVHQVGDVAEAEAAFCEAETMQNEHQPGFPLLYSVQGFDYCDLLLSLGRYQDVQRRGSQTLKWVTKEGWLVDIALDHLSLGRAYLLQALGKGTGTYGEAVTHLDCAVDGLRLAGWQEHLPRCLLARAELRRVIGALDKARNDLDEAFSICTRCGMRLYEADCHLEYARWHLASGDSPKARESLVKAKKMIEAMGYHRRDKEVEELEGQLGDV